MRRRRIQEVIIKKGYQQQPKKKKGGDKNRDKRRSRRRSSVVLIDFLFLIDKLLAESQNGRAIVVMHDVKLFIEQIGWNALKSEPISGCFFFRWREKKKKKKEANSTPKGDDDHLQSKFHHPIRKRFPNMWCMTRSTHVTTIKRWLLPWGRSSSFE